MAQVDPSDKSIKSFTVRHHKFDPVTEHFRWFDLQTFDTESEMNHLVSEIFNDIETRRLAGKAHPKEQVAGRINEPTDDSKTRIASAGKTQK